MTQLSPHFTLDELCITGTGLPNVPNKTELENLTYLASQLELVRALFDAPIHVSSGFRCSAVNKAVGGAKTSHHLLGCAADFTVSCVDIDAAAQIIADSSLDWCQLILEPSWLHISFIKGNAKREVLTAKRVKGKMIYSVGLNR